MKYKRVFFNGHEVVAELINWVERSILFTEKSLLERIANLEAQGFKTSVERKALAFIRVHDKYKPPKG